MRSRLTITPLVMVLALTAASVPAVERSAGMNGTLSTTATLERATQALVDALAPGQSAVWEHHTSRSTKGFTA
jgi:hypothetical protein